jgi:NitT/TauT family transport system substrate-binding protein
MTRFRAACCVALAFATLLVSACGSGAGQGDGHGGAQGRGSTTLTVAYAEKTASAAEETFAYCVPKALGLFSKHQLSVNMTYNDGSTAAIQSVASGSADLGFASAASIAAAVDKGVPIKAIAGATTFWPYRLATEPGSPVTSIADLKGRKIGVISLGSASYADLVAELKSAKLSIDDVHVVAVGADTSAAQALHSGQVDAIDTYRDAYTFLEAQGQRFAYLPTPESTKDLFSLTYFASDKAIASRRQALIAFIQSSYQGLIWSYTYPSKALQLLYQDFPKLPGANDPTGSEAKITAIQMQAAIDGWVPQTGQKDATQWGAWEKLPDSRWRSLLAWAKDTGQVQGTLAVHDVWDGSLMAEIYDFDAAHTVALKSV